MIDQYVKEQPIIGRRKRFNSLAGRLDRPTIDTMMESTVTKKDRVEPATPDGGCFSKTEAAGFINDESAFESARCLHCDCRAKDNCDSATSPKSTRPTSVASPARVGPSATSPKASTCTSTRASASSAVCVQIAEDAGEQVGLTYVGRGFNVKIAPPLDFDMDDAMAPATARRAAAACPTGALEVRGESPTARNPYDLFEGVEDRRIEEGVQAAAED